MTNKKRGELEIDRAATIYEGYKLGYSGKDAVYLIFIFN